MADAYKINVVIGGRTYPVSVENEAVEQGMRMAAKKINQLIADYENNYAVNDKQDVLAMCALQFASLIEVNQVLEDEENNQIVTEISKINSKLNEYLNK